MDRQKTFANYEQQLYILQQEKHIVISDAASAQNILEQIGYFPLIGGYKHLFRIPFTKTYKSGTSFEEIVALYKFDADLRELFFKYLLQIERHLRSLMSYYFSKKYAKPLAQLTQNKWGSSYPVLQNSGTYAPMEKGCSLIKLWTQSLIFRFTRSSTFLWMRNNTFMVKKICLPQ